MQNSVNHAPGLKCKVCPRLLRPVTDTADPRNSDNPAWSPDGSKILFDTNRSGESVELWIMNADGSEPTRLIADAFGQTSWQPISITGPCVGDCDGDDSVVVAELVTLIGISLGNIALVDCPAGDENQDGQISVDEIVGAVQNALTGCVAGTSP